jgi:tetratricopeptide (TPR) repeat protein
MPLSAGTRNDQDSQHYSERLSLARTAYFKVLTSSDQETDKAAHQALDQLQREYPNDPVGKAYQGSLELLDAAHNWAIWNLHKQAAEGLNLLDQAVSEAPDEPEARFIRAATSWHLPSFYHRKAQCEADFQLLASQAEEDANRGKLIPPLAAATLNYWGQILINRNDLPQAKAAFAKAAKIAPDSPGGTDARQRLANLK